MESKHRWAKHGRIGQRRGLIARAQVSRTRCLRLPPSGEPCALCGVVFEEASNKLLGGCAWRMSMPAAATSAPTVVAPVVDLAGDEPAGEDCELSVCVASPSVTVRPAETARRPSLCALRMAE